MAELNIGGETFHVVIEGDEEAPVLMLSNAIGTNLHMWDPQLPALLPHYRVLRYDPRGHGESVVSEGPYSIAGLGQDALAILDTLGLEKVDFLGLSLGGIIGQWLLTHAPERIGKAILADTASQIAPPDMWNSRIQTVLQEGMEPVVPGTIEHWFTRDFRDAHPDEIAKIEDMLLKTSPQGYAATCAAIRDVDLREAVRSVQAPVLVMVGRHDAITPPGISALLMSSMPKAKLVTLQAAHLSNVEDAEEFNAKALEFLLAEEPIPEPILAAPKPPRKPRVKKPKVESPVIEMPVLEPEEVAPAEKPVAKKASVKKAPVKKAPVKKAAPKKAAAKKTPAKKTSVKKAPAKKAAVKKAPAKKAAVKKTPVKKAAPKKAAPKKAATKKTVVKKTAVKQVAAKKTAVKKTVSKKIATKKTAIKKTPVKKSAIKKAAVKKPIKKAAAKKTKKR
jgi:3-oxoadipate enol-lactonase